MGTSPQSVPGKYHSSKLTKSRFHAQTKYLDLRNISREVCLSYAKNAGPWNWSSTSNYQHWGNQVQIISLAENKIRDQDLVVLFQGLFPVLKEIILYQNNIGDQGIEFIANKFGHQLLELRMQRNKITFLGLETVLIKIPNLVHLDVLSNTINLAQVYNSHKTEGLRWSPLSDKLLALKHLNINENIIGEKGCKILNKLNFQQLEILQLSSCQAGRGIVHLSKMHTPKLIKLDLNDNGITIDSLQIYLKVHRARNLKNLHLYKNKLQYGHSFELVASSYSCKKFDSVVTVKSMARDFIRIKEEFMYKLALDVLANKFQGP